LDEKARELQERGGFINGVGSVICGTLCGPAALFDGTIASAVDKAYKDAQKENMEKMKNSETIGGRLPD
jgi:hypothetical protein